jgi:predicted dehydrogenase
MEKIDIAVLGMGKMGLTHVKAALASPFVRKVYGYDPDGAVCASRGKELNIETTNDLTAIMNNSQIRLLDIAAPNAAHCRLVEAGLRSGKAILCEKPMAENLEDAAKVVAAVKNSGGFMQLGFELRYSHAYTTIKKWLDSGLIGTPVNIHCRYFCSEFHRKGTWRSRSSGSLIGEKLSHYLDLQRWLMNDKVDEVFAVSAPNVVEYFNHPDNHQITVCFRNGTVATLNFVMFLAESDRHDPLLDVTEKQQDDGHFLQLYVMGNQGAIEYDVFKRRIRRWQFTMGSDGLMSRIVETLTYSKEEDTAYMHNVHDQNLRVIELVARNLPPDTSVTDSFMTMQLCFAAELSGRERRIVRMSEFEQII